MNYDNGKIGSSERILLRILVFLIIIELLAAFGTVNALSVSDDCNDRIVVHRRHENSENKIALTFDDGPHPRYTPRILDILDRYGIKATFFTVGVNAFYYSDTFKMIVASGHEIGNHTYSHPKVSRIEQGRLKKEIQDCENLLYELAECKTKLFRPPEGMIDTDILNVIKDLDYSIILWDIDTRDWAHTSAKKIADNVIDNISSGDIILMHDYIGKDSPTCEALEIFIPELLKKGYKFVVVSELIGSK